MPRRALLALLLSFVAASGAASVASAQPAWLPQTVGIGAGYAVPVRPGFVTNVHDGGPQVELRLGFLRGERVETYVRATYVRFAGDVRGAQAQQVPGVEVTDVHDGRAAGVAAGVQNTVVAAGAVAVYLVAELGAYDVRLNDVEVRGAGDGVEGEALAGTYAGLRLGPGVRLGTGAVRLWAEPSYTMLFTDVQATHVVPLAAGITLRLP